MDTDFSCSGRVCCYEYIRTCQFYHAIYDYWSEKASFDQTKFAFDYYRESYFLTFSKKQADELMSHGYQLEYTNNECYVIRL